MKSAQPVSGSHGSNQDRAVSPAFVNIQQPQIQTMMSLVYPDGRVTNVRVRRKTS